uniref:Uncharacterized protein n=1 Tax=Oryza brachyantha TaxID=4533 RepID=J3M111_ORYBR
MGRIHLGLGTCESHTSVTYPYVSDPMSLRISWDNVTEFPPTAVSTETGVASDECFFLFCVRPTRLFFSFYLCDVWVEDWVG